MRDALRTRVSDSRAARDRDDHAFAGFPRVGDLVLFAVALQRRVDLVGQPQQGQFAQRRQVALAEVIGQRGVDALGPIHVAVGEPALQRFRRDVDQFDLVGRPHDVVGDPLLLLDARDPGDDVVQAFQVLHVDRRDHRDAGVEQFLDVLPALRVLAARGVGVGELVDQHHLRLPVEHRLDVEFTEALAPVLDVARRHDLDAVQQIGGLLAAVGLHDRGHHVRTALAPAVRLTEHRVRLADAGCRTQVDAQFAAPPLVVGPIAHLTIIHPDTSGRARYSVPVR